MIENWGEECFQHVASFGLKAVEFDYNGGNDPDDLLEDADDICSWIEKYDVKVMAIGRWGADKFDEEGKPDEEELQNSYKLIDACAIFGTPVFITGVNYVDALSFDANCDNAVDFLQKLVDYGKEKGVKICVYNCDWSNFVREPKTWEAVLGRVPELGIKYDPSHCINVHGGNCLEEIAEWGGRIYHVHLKGTLNFGGKHLDDPPAGLDMVNWNAVMGLLYKHKYEGMLSIEPHSSTWRGELGEWGIQYTINYFKDKIYGG